MNCESIFYDFISNCNTAIQVNALLLPATPYTWVITDKFDKQYSGVSISDGNGFFSIPIADLPPGFLTEFSGEFKLEVFEDTCRRVDLKLAKFYESIVFEVKGGSREKDNIGCDYSCTESGSGSGNSAVFPFEAAATVDIPWTAFLKGLYGNAPTVQVYQLVSPGVYQLVNVGITMVGGPYDLTEILVDNGGNADGYVLIS